MYRRRLKQSRKLAAMRALRKVEPQTTARDESEEETSYSAEAMEAERQRCYELGVASEREQWEYAVRNALHGIRGLEELLHRV